MREISQPCVPKLCQHAANLREEDQYSNGIFESEFFCRGDALIIHLPHQPKLAERSGTSRCPFCCTTCLSTTVDGEELSVNCIGCPSVLQFHEFSLEPRLVVHVGGF